jgi:hypothetical protein
VDDTAGITNAKQKRCILITPRNTLKPKLFSVFCGYVRINDELVSVNAVAVLRKCRYIKKIVLNCGSAIWEY